jgi:uncharacterized protein YjbI with pentapeptide repeats
MVGTNFCGAELVGTDLSSSNAKNAVLRDVDLTGTTPKSSGGCNRATFTAGTTFCRTTM